MKIELRHGAGGVDTSRLIKNIFARHFHSPVLDRMEDGAVLPRPEGDIVLTTDSFVVQPLEFAGGDIGRLSVCGTVNDLSCMGAQPRYLTAAFVLEEGLEADLLERIVASMAHTADEAGVQIVAGDTKVVEGNGGMFINTTGCGVRPAGRDVSSANLKPGDRLILSGTLGDHHGTILSARMNLSSSLKSDCAPLTGMVEKLFSGHIDVHTIRDVTRGGLATVLCELAEASGCSAELDEEAIPVSEGVRALCGILGLDPLTMGNEGKLLIAVPEPDAARALQIVKSAPYGKNAAVIGEVKAGKGVAIKTSVGSIRTVSPLRGEGLPRIC
ncbi:MAG TPA: hydrogenase expression/formation protein HypE [Ruminococcaceae bacterium]|nr:hydrogenase expression/formation protein HypE [Oscillospiraceae bacterium]